jgi:hypothetical protein
MHILYPTPARLEIIVAAAVSIGRAGLLLALSLIALRVILARPRGARYLSAAGDPAPSVFHSRKAGTGFGHRQTNKPDYLNVKIP